ncbi:response regulator transcription factor [bacterium]|nr:response regulator transcription factor [bacterium]
MSNIRIGIVDDHTLMRSGLRIMLESVPDFNVVGEAANAVQAYDMLANNSPEVILMDWSMPGENGLDVTRRLTREKSPARVIIVSMYDSAGFVRQAKLAGAAGYVVKGRSSDQLVDTIRQVASGASFVCPTKVDEPIPANASGSANQLDQLTTRQIEILRLLAIGRSNREIAETLYIAEKTVEHHKSNIKRELGISESARLVLFAVKHGLVRLDELETGRE